MNMAELTAATGTTQRQIRYLIVNGFVPAPTGGRAHAVYGEEHLQAVRRFKDLRALGLRLDEIKKIGPALADREQPKVKAPTGGTSLLARRSHALSVLTVDRLARDRPLFKLRYGEIGLDKCAIDMEQHIAHLRIAADYGQLDLFRNYVEWVRGLFDGLGLEPTDFFFALIALRDVLLEELDRGERAAPQAILNVVLKDYSRLEPDRRPLIELSAPHGTVAQHYLDALLSMRWTEAATLIETLIDDGLSEVDLHVHVIQPAMREIGRLWQTRRIGVEHEHIATAITLGVLARLSGDHAVPSGDAPVLVAACVADELHDIGLRMIADRYEREGWRVLFLGANAPVGAILTATIESSADMLALSATMTPHLDQVARTIEAIRADKHIQTTRIAVGGRPFLIAPDLWQKIGADTCHPDCSTLPLHP
ncbi:MerR family transcriptional regulator, light-induced transcriptional regulator [Azospirillaceae bacterium]